MAVPLVKISAPSWSMPSPSVEVQRDQGRARAGQEPDLVVEFLQRALGAADGDHVGAGAGERQGRGAADAAAWRR